MSATTPPSPLPVGSQTPPSQNPLPQISQGFSKDGCSFSLDLVKQFITIASAGIAFILGLASSSATKPPFSVVVIVLVAMAFSIFFGFACHSRLTGLIAQGKGYDAYEPIYSKLAKCQFGTFAFGFVLLAVFTTYGLWRSSRTSEKATLVPMLAQNVTNLLVKADAMMMAQTNLMNLITAYSSNRMAADSTYLLLGTNLVNRTDALLVAWQSDQLAYDSEQRQQADSQLAAVRAQQNTLQRIADNLQQSTSALAGISNELDALRQEVMKLQPSPTTNRPPTTRRWRIGIGLGWEQNN